MPKSTFAIWSSKRFGSFTTRIDFKGFRLKIFDAYRPLSAQFILWEAKPNINFVAPPKKVLFTIGEQLLMLQ